MSDAIASVELSDGTKFDIRRIEQPVAKALIVAEHYSHNWNTAFGVQNFGLYDAQGLAGALAYGYLMNPASAATLARVPTESIIELNRMWIADRLGPNTETAALSRTMRYLKGEGYQLIQTFADGRLGVGTVYKAANFGYYGASETLFHEDASGQAHDDTPFTNTARARGMIRQNLMHARGELSTFSVKTYRYLYPLTRYARRSILLTPEPYPAYQRGQRALPDYKPPAAQIARCQVMAEAMGYSHLADEFRDYLAGTYQSADVMAALDTARGNSWVAGRIADADSQPSLFDEVSA